MNDAIAGRVFVMIGAMLLAVGVFMPILSLPLRGSIDMFDLTTPGIALLVLAAVALLLAALDLSRHAIWPGLGSMAALGIGYVMVQTRIEEARNHELDIFHPKESIRGIAARAADLEFGWALLGVGALMVLAGSIMAWRARWLARKAVAPAAGEASELRAPPPRRGSGEWPAADASPLAPPPNPAAPPPTLPED